MNTQEILEELYSLRNYGGKMDLHATEHLCALLGNPHTAYPSIHVAGTNGKGTTCSILASVLAEAGLRVGLYTSPHIHRFNERVRICTAEYGAVEISDDDVLRLASVLMPEVRSLGASFFEATTALAFRYFAEQRVDVAVIETGLGGRLDCTNILQPPSLLASVITSIDFDHQEYLGNTLEAIASEKAGIIKPFTPAYIAEPRSTLRSVFQRFADERSATLLFMDDHVAVRRYSVKPMLTMNVEIQPLPMTTLTTPLDFHAPLCGEHQARNIVTAWWTLRECFPRLQEHCPAFHLDEQQLLTSTFQQGLARLRRNSGLEARIELLSEETPTTPLIVIDVSHNSAGLWQLCTTLKEAGYGALRWNVIFAAMQEKNIDEMLSLLKSIAQTLHLPHLRVARARPAEDIALRAHTQGIHTMTYPCTADVMHSLCARNSSKSTLTGASSTFTHKQSPVLIVGSFYLAEEALAWWHHYKIQASHNASKTS